MNNPLRKEKISNLKVTVSKDSDDKIKVKGSDMFERLYALIFILAKKASGKTNLIQNILKHVSGPNTKFLFIVSTIHKDKKWIEIVDEYSKKQKIEIEHEVEHQEQQEQDTEDKEPKLKIKKTKRKLKKTKRKKSKRQLSSDSDSDSD